MTCISKEVDGMLSKTRLIVLRDCRKICIRFMLHPRDFLTALKRDMSILQYSRASEQGVRHAADINSEIRVTLGSIRITLISCRYVIYFPTTFD